MSVGTRDDLIKSVETHLAKPKALIAVTQGGHKLQKNASHNKFNWTKADVEQEFGSVANLIDSLKDKGFTTGAVLVFRFVHGSTTRYEGEIKLNIGPSNTNEVNKQAESMDPQTPQPAAPQPAAPQPATTAPPPMALGYTQVPQHEFINLKVLEQRHLDLVEKNQQTQKRLDETESDLRKAKEDLDAANRTIALKDEKHEFEIERIRRETKGFFDSDAGKAAIEAAPMLAEKFFDRLDRRNAPAGMGNPIKELSEYKQIYFEEFKEIPEEVVPALYEVLELTVKTDGFIEKLTAFINAEKAQAPSM